MHIHTLRRIGPVIACVGGLMFHAAGSATRAAETLETIETHNSVADPARLPHTAWARPYARGTTRALFVIAEASYTNALVLRRVADLMQRFDITGEAVAVRNTGTPFADIKPGKSPVYGGLLGEQRLARLLEDRHDCYFVIGEIMGLIPASARATMLRNVRAGTGLVSLGDTDARILAGANPLDTPPAFLSDLPVDIYTLGEGRIVVDPKTSGGFNAGLPTPAQAIFGFDFVRDVYHETQGRLLLWAAGREPQLELSLSVADTLRRADLPATAITVTSRGPTPPGTLRFRARVRDLSNAAKRFDAITPDETTGARWKYTIPILPAGTYHFDLIADSDRGVEAWASAPFTVTAESHVTDVELQRDWGLPGDPITGTVGIQSNDQPQTILRVEVIDRDGRSIARRDYPHPGEKVGFSLSMPAGTRRYLAVKASLRSRSGRDEICRAYSTPYTIAVSKQDQFGFVVWGRLFANDLLDAADIFMADHGVTARMETTQVPWWYMSRAGMNYVPYCVSGLWRPPDTGRLYPTVDAEGLPRLGAGCWNDEPAVSQRVAKFLADEMDYRKHGVLVYSMGDEQTTRGGCLHPSCWQRYRDYLKQQYEHDIDALNASWGTAHDNFDQIEPFVDTTALPWMEMPRRLAWQKSYANIARSSIGPTAGSTAWDERLKSYPRWYDRGAFHYWNFAKYVERFAKEAGKMDPGARAGVEGTSDDLDQDIDTIVRHSGFWMPYQWQAGSPPNEVIRSIAPKGYRHGNFIGRTNFWFSFIRGANTIAKFRAESFLSPQMTIKADLRRMIASARIVFDGLGTLLNVDPRTRMLHDGVVMLHSYPSFQAMKLEHGPSYGRTKDRNEDTGQGNIEDQRHKRSHRAWHRTIRACGLQFQYVTDRQILRGQFDADPYRLMILSQCESIGPEVQSVIRDFVVRGGTVIADVRPGIFGARCQPRPHGALDDLFGVRHTENAEVLATPGRIVGAVGGHDVAVEVLDMRVNPAVQLTTGTALGWAGRTPIGIVHRVGKGQAILLNFTMWSYPNIAEHNGPDDAHEFMHALFASTGISPPLKMLDQAGRPHRNLEAVRWRTGPGVEVVAVHGPEQDTWLDDDGPIAPPLPFDGLDTPVPMTIRLPTSRYVYEMRTGRHSHGRTTQFTTNVRPWQASLLVLSDHRLSAPILKRQPSSVVAEANDTNVRFVVIEARVPGAREPHALKIRVTDPDGQPAPWFDRSAITTNGITIIDLPIAHNERTGQWQMTATDLYTTKSASITFLVE